jgi:hypothetical protein
MAPAAANVHVNARSTAVAVLMSIPPAAPRRERGATVVPFGRASTTMELELTASPVEVHRAYDDTFKAWLLAP